VYELIAVSQESASREPGMLVPSRILLIEDRADAWQPALAQLGEERLMEQTTVVRDGAEALDFLLSRGRFERRPAGFPAVVVVGPHLSSTAALALLQDIRANATLRRIPVVIIAAELDAETIRGAYARGANSVVRSDGDVQARAQRYAALVRFWGWANEPPPGCLARLHSQRPRP
jgi:CheY-like chemotaxis protein